MSTTRPFTSWKSGPKYISVLKSGHQVLLSLVLEIIYFIDLRIKGLLIIMRKNNLNMMTRTPNAMKILYFHTETGWLLKSVNKLGHNMYNYCSMFLKASSKIVIIFT